MNIELQVTSLELSKKLLTLGVKQNSIFVWEYYDDLCYAVKFIPFAVYHTIENKFKLYSAFLASELMELLPHELSFKKDIAELTIWKGHDFYHCNYLYLGKLDGEFHNIFDNKLSDCLAKMLIWLYENGYIKND